MRRVAIPLARHDKAAEREVPDEFRTSCAVVGADKFFTIVPPILCES
jgi:hypothetical protein